MSEDRVPYVVSNPPSQEITGSRFRTISVGLDEYTPIKALAKAHGIPLVRLHRLLLSVGLHHVTVEQIHQVRDARAKELREMFLPETQRRKALRDKGLFPPPTLARNKRRALERKAKG